MKQFCSLTCVKFVINIRSFFQVFTISVSGNNLNKKTFECSTFLIFTNYDLSKIKGFYTKLVVYKKYPTTLTTKANVRKHLTEMSFINILSLLIISYIGRLHATSRQMFRQIAYPNGTD